MKYNYHFHAFTNLDLGGNYLKVISEYCERKISNSKVFRFVLRILNPFSSKTKLDYLANYLREQGKSTRQKVNEYFEYIHNKYPFQDWGVNILTVDFDYMHRGKPKRFFEDQLIAALKVKYENEFNKAHIKVFMGIDPRRPNLVTLVKKYLNQIDGFKLYCYNGFFPYDENLDVIYSIAEMYNKPVLFHCSDTNINYYGGKDISKNLQESLFPLLKNRKGNKELSTNFCNPLGYEYVIKKNPNVNFVIAHWGGNEFLNTSKFFTNIITDIVLTYDNAYVDVAYFAYDDYAKFFIKNIIKENPKIITKIIFGDDAPMIENEGGKDVIYDLENYIGKHYWEIITNNYKKL